MSNVLRGVLAGCAALLIAGAASVAAAQGGLYTRSAIALYEAGQGPGSTRPEFPPLGDPIENLKPAVSGPGVVICEPVSAPDVNAETADFAAGCSRWLQFVVGGQGQLSKTPLWEALNRARRELNRQDLRLKPTETPRLATILGITHAATGTVSGSAANCTLKFQLIQIAGQKPAGPPVALTGSTAQIVQKLPTLATTLSKQLGLSAPQIPNTVGAEPNEIAALGRMPLGLASDLKDAESAQLVGIARHFPLGLLFLMNSPAAEDQQNLKITIKTSLEQCSNNALIYGQIAQTKPELLIDYQSQLVSLCQQYPLNAPLAIAASRLFLHRQQYERERKYSEQAIRGSYRSPDAWIALSTVYNFESNAVRQGRGVRSLSEEEIAYTRAANEKWVQSGMRAVELDDRNSRAWINVASAATFGDDKRLMETAFWNALRLDPDDAIIYQWGLQIYQPKWFDNPENLREIAEKALHAHFASQKYALFVVDALNDCGFKDKAKQLTTQIISRQEAIVQSRPNDVNALRLLGSACFRTNRYPDGLKYYRKIAELSPNDARSVFELGTALMMNSQQNDALLAFQKAVSLDPHNAEAHKRCAEMLHALHRSSEAIRAYQEYLSMAPRDEAAYEQIAALLIESKRVPEAIQAAQKATQLMGSSSRAHELLGEAFLLDKQYDMSVIHLREAVRLNPQNSNAKQKLDEALNK